MKIKLKRDRDFKSNGISEIKFIVPINVFGLSTKDVWLLHRNSKLDDITVNVDLFDWMIFKIRKLFSSGGKNDKF